MPNPRHEGTHAPTPVASARRAPECGFHCHPLRPSGPGSGPDGGDMEVHNTQREAAMALYFFRPRRRRIRGSLPSWREPKPPNCRRTEPVACRLWQNRSRCLVLNEHRVRMQLGCGWDIGLPRGVPCRPRLRRDNEVRGQGKLKGCPEAGIVRCPYSPAMGLDD